MNRLYCIIDKITFYGQHHYVRAMGKNPSNTLGMKDPMASITIRNLIPVKQILVFIRKNIGPMQCTLFTKLFIIQQIHKYTTQLPTGMTYAMIHQRPRNYFAWGGPKNLSSCICLIKMLFDHMNGILLWIGGSNLYA